MISVEEYEGLPEFQSLLVAAKGKPERQMGSSIIPAEPPQWGVVRSTAISLLEKTPAHLSPLVHLVKAEANLNGFIGMNEALNRTKASLLESWGDMYPEADPDDPEDMYYARINLLREISDEPDFIENLYRAPLVSIKGIGEYSCRDIDISRGVLPGDDEEKERCQDGLIRGAFKESDPAQLQATGTAFAELIATSTEIEALFLEKAGAYNELSLAALKSKVEAWRGVFTEYAQAYIEVDQENAVSAVDGADDLDKLEVHHAVATGLLKNRQDALQALDHIIEYYCSFEPSSPVGVLAQRAKDMVTKPFFAVLHELAPTQKDSFELVLTSLAKNPTAFLLNDSYTRFLGGEQFPTLPTASKPEQPRAVEPVVPAVAHDVPGDASSSVDAPSNANGEIDAPLAVAQADTIQTNTNAVASSIQTVSVDEPHSVSTVNSRSDVIATLGELEFYFLEQEPSNPIPLVLSDMKKMVPKKFAELLADFSRDLAMETEAKGQEA